MRHGTTKNQMLAAACAATLLAVGDGRAADGSGQEVAATGALADIIVTATRRSEALQDVPISVVAFDTEALRDFDVRRADDIARLAPNLSARGTMGDTHVNYYIRGVGETNFHLNSVGAVGIYFDEVSYNSSASSSFSLFDMERVEVLRGPQNTLYGRNTTGGAINFVSQKPVIGGGTSGYAQATVGRFTQIDGEGAIGADLGERAAIRISGSVNTRNGVQHNIIYNEKIFETERYAGRVQLLVEPSDAVSVLANVHGGWNRGDMMAYKAIGLLDPVNPVDPNGTTAATYLIPCAVPVAQLRPGSNCGDVTGFVDNGGWRDVASVHPKNRNDIDAWGGSVKVDWKLPAVTFTSVSSYERNKLARGGDAGVRNVFRFYQNLRSHQISQEFRLTSASEQRWRWIAGAMYFKEDAHFSTHVRRRPPAGPDGIAIGPGELGIRTIIPSTVVGQQTLVYSAYGQTDFDLTDRLTLTAGLRWSRDKKEGHNFAFVGEGSVVDPLAHITAAIAETQINFVAADDDFGKTWNKWGGKIGLDFKVTDDVLVYGSVSRGFKSGGFSLAAQQAIVSAAANRAVGPETLTAYELGIKSTLLDGSMRLNAAVFYNDWKDQQTFTLAFDGAISTPLLVNIPKTELYGAELEWQWGFAPGWLLQGGVGYMQSKVKDATNLPTIAVGNDLINIPEITFNGLLRKEWQLAAGSFMAQVDARYVDDVYYTIDADPVAREPGYWEIGARAALNFGDDERYQVAAAVQNLNGAKYCSDTQSLRAIGEAYQCLPNIGVPLYSVTFRAKF